MKPNARDAISEDTQIMRYLAWCRANDRIPLVYKMPAKSNAAGARVARVIEAARNEVRYVDPKSGEVVR